MPGRGQPALDARAVECVAASEAERSSARIDSGVEHRLQADGARRAADRIAGGRAAAGIADRHRGVAAAVAWIAKRDRARVLGSLRACASRAGPGVGEAASRRGLSGAEGPPGPWPYVAPRVGGPLRRVLRRAADALLGEAAGDALGRQAPRGTHGSHDRRRVVCCATIARLQGEVAGRKRPRLRRPRLRRPPRLSPRRPPGGSARGSRRQTFGARGGRRIQRRVQHLPQLTRCIHWILRAARTG